MGRGSGKKGKNLNELKQELEIDVHRVSVDELCKRFNSNVGEGLTDDQVAKGIAEHGLNQLTPPKTTPEWVKFCQCLFSGFAMLLWFGAILSYTPGMDKGLRMYPLKFNWWLPAIPFSVLIFCYDETRKFLLRRNPGGWIEQE